MGVDKTVEPNIISKEEHSISIKQLEKKWKYAADFGVVTIKRNLATLGEFQRAISGHLNDSNTVPQGTYQYISDSKVFFNSKTNLVVIQVSGGNFVSGWMIIPGTPQFEKFINNGVLR